jgi:Protein of unknown function (DUF2637)
LNNPTHLRRIRWIVRLTLVLGVAASIAANVLHARDNLISQTIAAWPPLALLLTVELISRVPVHHRGLAGARVCAAAIIAAIAAWVSYWHMAGVTARYGESPASAQLMPISVDGLIVVASISLVELAGRIRALDTAAASMPPAGPAHATPSPTAASPLGGPAGAEDTAAAAPAKKAPRARAATPARKANPTSKTTPARKTTPATADTRPANAVVADTAQTQPDTEKTLAAATSR